MPAPQALTIVLDTNVIIDSESNKVLDEKVQDLFRKSQELNIGLSVSKHNRTDFLRDKDVKRQEIMLAKINKYPQIEFARTPDDAYFELIGKQSIPGSNDYIDDCLLFAILKDGAHFLITEDKKILSKANELGIQDRIFGIKGFIDYLDTTYGTDTPMLPTVETVLMSELDRKDKIFASLRKDYIEFDEWFADKAREERKAWVIKQGEKIAALCIFDPFNDDCEGQMKLCTFKVDDDFGGQKFGECLFKQACIFGHANKIKFMRIDVIPSKNDMVYFMEEFGFHKIGVKNEKGRIEEIWQKDLSPVPKLLSAPKNPLELSKKYFPYYVEPPFVEAYVVPIRPNFSKVLYPELAIQQSFFVDTCGNAIKKAYLCKAVIKKIAPGDLLFFYESKDRQAIIAAGVTDEVMRHTDLAQILKFIGKRSVYSADEIKEMLKMGEVLAIKFRQLPTLTKEVPIQKMIDHGILVAPPQQIASIKNGGYPKLAVLL